MTEVSKASNWLSRDPIVEEGGENLQGLLSNDAVNDFDLLDKIRYYFGVKSCVFKKTLNWSLEFEGKKVVKHRSEFANVQNCSDEKEYL